MSADFDNIWASRDSDQIARMLADLLDRPPPRPPIPPPDPAIFDTFPSVVPTKVVMDYVALLGNYRPMQPDPSPGEVVQRWVEAVLRTGNGSAALQVVLALSEDDDPFPGADVRDALEYVAARGVHSTPEIAGAEHLARHFLDHSQTYDRARHALTAWRNDNVLAEILQRVTAYVRPEHRTELGLPPAAGTR